MDPIVLDNIPFQANFSALMDRLHIREGSRHAEELRQLAEEAQATARPKAFYRLAFVELCSPDTVRIDGILFTSRVLRVNLEHTHRVFAYVATCGTELHEWARTGDDMLRRFWADAIAEMALRSARDALKAHLETRYDLGPTSTMNPGSLADWPIQQQRPLFELLGDTQRAVGVELLPSMLMVPTKTVSGLLFPTQENFASCQLCPRPDCPGRRAPHDPDLYERKYALPSSQTTA